MALTIKSLALATAGLWTLTAAALVATPSKLAKDEAAKAARQVKAGEAVLVDVREADEVKAGIAEGAKWLATSAIKSKDAAVDRFVAALPKDKPVYVYCGVGVRAAGFVEELKERGYKAANLGGIEDVKAAGLSTQPATELPSP